MCPGLYANVSGWSLMGCSGSRDAFFVTGEQYFCRTRRGSFARGTRTGLYTPGPGAADASVFHCARRVTT
jgi:hypothetical protein